MILNEESVNAKLEYTVYTSCVHSTGLKGLNGPGSHALLVGVDENMYETARSLQVTAVSTEPQRYGRRLNKTAYQVSKRTFMFHLFTVFSS